MRKRYSRSYTVLSFLTMFSYREQPFGGLSFFCVLGDAAPSRTARSDPPIYFQKECSALGGAAQRAAPTLAAAGGRCAI